MQMWGERNFLSFETAVGGIEPPSPRHAVTASLEHGILSTEHRVRFYNLSLRCYLAIGIKKSYSIHFAANLEGATKARELNHVIHMNKETEAPVHTPSGY